MLPRGVPPWPKSIWDMRRSRPWPQLPYKPPVVGGRRGCAAWGPWSGHGTPRGGEEGPSGAGVTTSMGGHSSFTLRPRSCVSAHQLLLIHFENQSELGRFGEI